MRLLRRVEEPGCDGVGRLPDDELCEVNGRLAQSRGSKSVTRSVTKTR